MDKDAAAAAPRSEDWSLLPWVLAGAFLLRFAWALYTETIQQPDEVYQYLEQAHRLVFGQGFIPWEFQHGARSWLIAAVIAAPLELCKLLGLGRPDVYQPLVKALLCVAATTLPLSLYRIGQATLGEAGARTALVASSLWYELVNMGARPFPDALGAYALFGALSLLLAPRQRWADLAFGALCGLTVALRFQFVPAVGALLFVALILRRGRIVQPLLAFAAVVVVLAGALDALTVGEWFGSSIENARYNVVEGMASTFGVSPPWQYLIILLDASAGLAALGALGLVVSVRRTWPASLPLLVQFAAFSAISHKEPRFIVFFLPLWLFGLAALLPLRTYLLAAVLACVSILGATRLLPFESRVYPHPILARSDVRDAYRILARQDGVTGLVDASGVVWGDTGGFYDFNQPAPIYRPDIPATQFHKAARSPRLYASHWLARAGTRPPPGFGDPQRIGGLILWKNLGDPAQVAPPAGYSAKLPDLALIRRRPRGASPSS